MPKRILKMWTKFAANIRMRDRIVKVIQYGCQMILGYYAMKLSDGMKKGLAETRRFSSNARKAFWLFKSFNHIHSCIHLYENGVLQTEYIADKLDLLEQFFLAIYFATENFVYFIRSQILTAMSEKDIDFYLNCSWFGADLSSFLAASIRLIDNQFQLNHARSLQKQVCQEEKHSMRHIELCSNNDLKAMILQHQSLDKTLNTLYNKQFDLALSTVINIFELGVSAYYMKLYKYFFNIQLSEGHVGLMGVLSSTLILYEGYLSVSREMLAEDEKTAAALTSRVNTQDSNIEDIKQSARSSSLSLSNNLSSTSLALGSGVGEISLIKDKSVSVTSDIPCLSGDELSSSDDDDDECEQHSDCHSTTDKDSADTPSADRNHTGSETPLVENVMIPSYNGVYDDKEALKDSNAYMTCLEGSYVVSNDNEQNKTNKKNKKNKKYIRNTDNSKTIMATATYVQETNKIDLNTNKVNNNGQ